MELSWLLLFWCLLDRGASGVDTDGVSVMEGDSVTLNTGVQTSQQEKIKWYYNVIRIAQINRDQSKICTDVQCNEGTERFRDRLKLDRQTGSLTIMNITNTHAGVYKLKIINHSDSEKIFNVSVQGVSAAEREEVKRKEGESVTLYTGVLTKPINFTTWYFNDILIAEITRDQSKICTDDQCKERFRDRLKLDHQTGSLIITHTRTEDSGEYKLQIGSDSSRHRRSIIKRFSVSVTDSGSSSAVIAGMSAGVVLLFVTVAVAVICYRCHMIYTQRRKHEDDEASWEKNMPVLTVDPNEATNDQNEPLSTTVLKVATNDQEESPPTDDSTVATNDQKESLSTDVSTVATNDQKESLLTDVSTVATNDQKESLSTDVSTVATNDQKESLWTDVSTVATNDQKESLSTDVSTVVTNDQKESLSTDVSTVATNDQKESLSTDVSTVASNDQKESLWTDYFFPSINFSLIIGRYAEDPIMQ
ncbi:hypothetical protein F2P79_025535 [Pimephales promelas]|nr:hypothetical protein F2P79_025535 [Pimephales promelas]